MRRERAPLVAPSAASRLRRSRPLALPRHLHLSLFPSSIWLVHALVSAHGRNPSRHGSRSRCGFRAGASGCCSWKNASPSLTILPCPIPDAGGTVSRRNPGALSPLPRDLDMMVDSGDATGIIPFSISGGMVFSATPASASWYTFLYCSEITVNDHVVVASI